MGDVDVVLRKWDGRPHRRLTARLLGTDEFGTWLGVPAGTVVTYSYGGKPPRPTAQDAVRLIPPGAWWCAVFFGDPSHLDAYCDVIAPARWAGSEVTLVDLDLDLVRYRPGGRVELDDEDEFAENSVTYGYPPEVVEHARAAAEQLQAALIDCAEPFGERWKKWMERV